MGNRLSKIYTRTGDKGETGLGDGSRVSKDSARVEAYGCVDELNAAMGLLLAQEIPASMQAWLAEVGSEIQHDLFDLGGELCIPGMQMMKAEQVERLEQWLDEQNEHLAPLKEFILRGGSAAAAHAHFACTVARRAERRMVTLAASSEVSAEAIAYVNRLSDLLFVIARALNLAAGGGDVLWRRAVAKD